MTDVVELTAALARIDSVIQSLSKAYFRKNAIPSTSTMVPTQSSSRPPIAASTLS